MRLSGTKTYSVNQYRGLGNQLWDLAGVLPTLDLRFAENKTLNDYMTGQNLITFSRPVGANQSPGTYVDENGIIQLSSADQPRFDHDPTTGESLGLLVEEERTNLLVRSEEFDDVSWTTINASAAPAVGVVAPDGTETAYTVTSTVAGGIIREDVVTASAVTYTWSCFIKKKTSPEVEISVIRVGGTAYVANLTYNFDTDTVELVSDDYGDSPYGRELLSNGWVRVYATVTDQGSNTQARMYLRPSSQEASDMYVWGAQLEEGSFPTSYIPTTGTALTRSADTASITGSNFSSWYNQSEGTVFSEANFSNNVSYNTVFNITDGTANERISTIQWNDSLTNRILSFTSSNTQQANLVGNSVVGKSKNAAAYKTNDFAGSQDGGTVLTDTSGSVSTLVDRLELGTTTNVFYLNGHISRLTYFPYRLPDSSLQAITTP